MKLRALLWAVLTAASMTFLTAILVPAQATDSGMVVLQSRATASLPGAGNSAVYLTLHNAGSQADRLLSASSPQAARVEMHATMIMSGGTATMHSLSAIDVPLGGMVSMAPGGTHLMVTGVKQPLQVGGKLSLTLKFAKAGVVTIEVPIVSASELAR